MNGEMEAVVCELKYSGAVSLAIAVAAMASLAIVLVLPWSAPLRASIALAACGMALRAARAIHRVQCVCVEADARVMVTFRDGQTSAGRLRDGSFVAAWLTILRWRPDGAWFDRTVLVVPAMARPGPLRRLRVRLRLG